MSLQVYETRIVPDGDQPGHRFVQVSVFPERLLQAVGFAAPSDEGGLARLVEGLDLVPGVRLETPDDLANYVFAGFWGRETDFGYGSSERWGQERSRRQGRGPDVAADVVFGASIPVERSPVQGKTLADIVAGLGGVALTIGGPMVLGPVGMLGFVVSAVGGLIYVKVVRPGFDAVGDIVRFKIYERAGLSFLYPTDDPDLRRYLIERQREDDATRQITPPPGGGADPDAE